MSDHDELASSPVAPADVSLVKRKRKKKRAREEDEATAAPPDTVEADASNASMDKPRKKKRKVDATEVEETPVLLASPPKKKRKRAKDGEAEAAVATEAVPDKGKARARESNGFVVPKLPASMLASMQKAAADRAVAQAGKAAAFASNDVVESAMKPPKPPKVKRKAIEAIVNGHPQPEPEPAPAPIASASTSSTHSSLRGDVAELRTRLTELADLRASLDALASKRSVTKKELKDQARRLVALEEALPAASGDRLTALEESVEGTDATMKTVLARLDRLEGSQGASGEQGETERLRSELAARGEENRRLREELERLRGSADVASLFTPKAASSAGALPAVPVATTSKPALPESESDPSEADTEDEAPASTASKAPRPRLSLLDHAPISPAASTSTMSTRSAPTSDLGFKGGKDLALETLRPARLSVDAAYLALAQADDDENAMPVDGAAAAANGVDDDDDDDEGSDATPVASSEPSPKVTKTKRGRRESETPSIGASTADEQAEAATRAPRVVVPPVIEAVPAAEEEETLEDVVEKSVVEAEPDVTTGKGVTLAAVDQEEPAPAAEDTASSEEDTPAQPATQDSTSSRISWTPVNDDDAAAADDDDQGSQIDWSQPPSARPVLPDRAESPTPVVAPTLPAAPQRERSEEPATIDPSVFLPRPAESASPNAAADDAVEAESTTTLASAKSTRAKRPASPRKAASVEAAADASLTPLPKPERTTRASVKAASQTQSQSSQGPKRFEASFAAVASPRVPPTSSQASAPKTLSDLEKLGKEGRIARMRGKVIATSSPSVLPAPAVKDSRLARLAGNAAGVGAAAASAEEEEESSESD